MPMLIQQRPQGVHITGPVTDPETKAFGNFLRRGVERIAPEEVKALTVANDASAGYLPRQEFGSELIKLLTEFSPIWSYAPSPTERTWLGTGTTASPARSHWMPYSRRPGTI
mgnify:CR=1 FL=1